MATPTSSKNRPYSSASVSRTSSTPSKTLRPTSIGSATPSRRTVVPSTVATGSIAETPKHRNTSNHVRIQNDKTSPTSTDGDSLVFVSYEDAGPVMAGTPTAEAFRDFVLETSSMQHAQQHLDKDILRASAKGRIDVLKRLLTNPCANASCQTSHGMTPLHYAAANGHLGIAEMLLQHGADALAMTDAGKTAAELAVARNHDVLVALINDFVRSRGLTPVCNHTQHETDSTCMSRQNSSPYHHDDQVSVSSCGSQLGAESNSSLMSWDTFQSVDSRPSSPVLWTPKKRDRSGSCVEYIHVTVRADLIRGPFYSRYQTYAVSVMAQHPLFGEQSFNVRRRFCEFYAFHQQLVTVYMSSARRRQEARSDRSLFRELLRWKPKKVFWGGLVPSVVEQRRNGFEHLLKVASSDTDLVKCMVEFLCGYSPSDI